MTIDEAIEHANAVADSYKDTNPECQCAKDNRRLAGWLTELKMARESAFAEIPQMAQTISENNNLKTENARLWERIVALIRDSDEQHAMYRRLSELYDEVAAERNKLRELAKYAVYCAEGDIRCEGCPMCEKDEQGVFWCRLRAVAIDCGVELAP